MLQLPIPGENTYSIEHLVLDFNGTLGLDGGLIDGVEDVLDSLAKKMSLHILTADTHGNVARKVNELPASLHIIGGLRQDVEKYNFIQQLGSSGVAAIGNGRNDALMLQEAALGIAVIQSEGCAGLLIAYADVICASIIDALELLVYPARLQATLRN